MVKTDHRPLEQIHKKNLMQAPPRLQRMLLRLQPYDCVIKYRPVLKPYWPLRDDISVEDGLILLGSRVIVPESLRGNIFQQIHGGHFGIEKWKL